MHNTNFWDILICQYHEPELKVDSFLSDTSFNQSATFHPIYVEISASCSIITSLIQI